MEQALKFRNSLQQASSVSLDAVITADYESIIHTFKMNCLWDTGDQMKFTVLEPDSISGIAGTISQESGKILFDDKALFFETMADGQVSPISATWLMMRAMKSGYIKGAGSSEGGYLVQLDDSYNENALNLNLQLNEACEPMSAEIFYDGRRVVSISVENFKIM
ncbi:MAG: hypothetical protein IKJ94_00405 [Oscillospiraceae bacterium]|nr:hypothetical protein [Oscillospiraceae bacterium]